MKNVEERIKKIEEGNVVKRDSLLSLTILIDFFRIAVYLTLFVLNSIRSRLQQPRDLKKPGFPLQRRFHPPFCFDHCCVDKKRVKRLIIPRIMI